MAGVSSVTPLPPILVSSSFAGERRRHDEETIFEKEDSSDFRSTSKSDRLVLQVVHDCKCLTRNKNDQQRVSSNSFINSSSSPSG